MNYGSAFRDPAVARRQVAELATLAQRLSRPVTLMEVCGTHTMAIHQHGIRSLLPPAIRLISGPGCPVCVTPITFIDHSVALARRPGTLLTTFGDMMRVPGSSSSLLREKARGADIRVVYSALDAVALAEKHPQTAVVFLGIGFETTAPTVAGAILEAQRRGRRNFFVLGAHKTIPGPMALLASDPELRIDGYLAPAHVSAIIGADAYEPLARAHHLPCVVTGFEPLDILQGIIQLIRQHLAGTAQVENEYSRSVRRAGNPKAQRLLAEVFMPCAADWRGLGRIPGSGLTFRPAFTPFDAAQQLPVTVEEPREPPGCCCGEILTGQRVPRACPLFATVCTPEHPVGACMVSSEGSCAAEYKYGVAP